MFRVLLGALIVMGVVVAYIWTPAPKSKPASAKGPAPVTISVAAALRKDVPIILSGIGTVQALNAAQIKSRVDGTLEQVNFHEGQRVKKGDVLAVIDQRLYKAALDQAKAKLQQDEAQLISDLKDLERSKQLRSNQFASQQVVDQLTAKVGVGKALVEADKAMVETAQTNLDYTVITAPFDGLMGLRNVDPGNIVRASDNLAIATIIQHQPIYVVFTLPEGQLGHVRQAMKAGDVSVKALDTDGKKSIGEGMLRVVDNQIDQTSGTIKLKAQFDNKDDVLWPGQFTPVTLQVGEVKGAVTAPTAALQRGPNGIYVWLAGADGRAEMRTVETGVAHDGVTAIVKGLSEGEQIITSNQYRLRPGAPVRVDASSIAASAHAGRS